MMIAVSNGFSEPACWMRTSANDTQRKINIPSLVPLQMETNAIVAVLINGKKLPISATNNACHRPRKINSARAFTVFYLF
jgi:hypothetical protein